MGRTLSTRALNRALLARQGLLARRRSSALRVIGRVVGLQAQQARPPLIGLASRIEDFGSARVLRAIRQRKLVRATMMRSTLHLLRADDYLSLRAAIQPALSSAMKSTLRDRLSGLDLDTLVVEGREAFAEPLDFKSFRARLGRRHPKADVRAMAYAVRNLVPLISVPSEDRWGFSTTGSFVTAEAWLGEPIAPHDAAEELVTRYLAAFGPATPADAQTWSGRPGLREVFEAMRAKLRSFADERGRELFDLPRAPRPDPEVAAPVRMIAGFDNLVLAHADRSRIVPDEHRKAVVSKNLQVRPTFLIDGFVAGTWKLELRKRATKLRLSAFAGTKLPRGAKPALRAEAELIARFVAPEVPRIEVFFA